MNNSEEALNAPPFPPLRPKDGGWEGEATLTAWAGFQARQGAYGSVSSDGASNGAARVRVENQSAEGGGLPLPEQTAAFAYLLEHQDAIRDAILAELLKQYPEWRLDYGPSEGEEDDWMPVVTEAGGFKPLMGLSWIHVLDEVLDGVGYIGLEFGCTWDDEHDLGALLHRERVVEIGGADTAFLGWNARQDAEKQRGA